MMWANNEVGTVMPVAELAAVAAEFGVPIHSDAVQAVGQIPVDFADSGLSAMSVTAHKFGGPTGVGALVLRRDTAASRCCTAAGRSATCVPAQPMSPVSVAIAAAARIAVDPSTSTAARLRGAARPADRRSARLDRRHPCQRRAR